MPLVIEKRAVRQFGRLHWCVNGCMTGGSVNTPKVGTHIAWVVGRPVYLCAKCAKAWPGMWERALGNFSEDQEHQSAERREATLA